MDASKHAYSLHDHRTAHISLQFFSQNNCKTTN